MKATYADESWKGISWFENIILAHINFNQKLDWFYELLFHIKYELLFHIKKDILYEKEFKSTKAIKVLNSLDIKIQNKIWMSLQDTIIIILDPKEYIKMTGVLVLQDGSFKIKYKEKELIIRPSDEAYQHLNKRLQEKLSIWILEDSPLSRVRFSALDLPNISPRENLFNISYILSLINKDDSRKKVMGTIKLAARLCSAFFELIDPEEKKQIVEQLYQYSPDFIFTLGKYHQEMLRKSISSYRFFDKGHSPSVNIIKDCFEKIEQGLKYYDNEINSLPNSIVKEIDSKEDIRIQACDWASGIARRIFNIEGLEGLKRKFNRIILNGKMI